MFTIDAAYLTHEEKIRGSLSIGKYGDIAICDRNIKEMDLSDPDKLREIRFTHTIVGGEVRYSLY